MHVVEAGSMPIAASVEEDALLQIETFLVPMAPGGATDAGRRPTKISVGILAYNEETAIQQTIASIGEQSIIEDGRAYHLEIICVANGCRDRTAELAGQAIDRLREQRGSWVTGRVEVVERPSKENAWNEFVHRCSSVDSDFLVFMDGDVKLLNRDSLRSMVEALRASPRAYVCGARTVKHLELLERKRWVDRISLSATSMRRHASRQVGRVGFAGCLYAARASACRRFRLPTILRGEDCFLLAMWVTDFFTMPNHGHDPSRIVMATDAAVLFEAYTSPTAVLKNLRRRAVEITINSMIYDRLWAESTPREDAGALLLRWSREDPEWEQQLLRDKVKERGRWVPPGGPFLRWISSNGPLWAWVHRLGGMPWPRKLAYLPVAVIGTAATLYAYMAANRLIRSGKLDNLWFTTATKLSTRVPSIDGVCDSPSVAASPTAVARGPA